jgi:hypothetical protein
MSGLAVCRARIGIAIPSVPCHENFFGPLGMTPIGPAAFAFLSSTALRFSTIEIMKTTQLILLAALACISTALAIDPPLDEGSDAALASWSWRNGLPQPASSSHVICTRRRC